MYSLPKRERLHLKKHIDELFAQGKGFVAYPLRVVYQTEAEDLWGDCPRAMMMVSVGKRNFKRANKRNRIKRLMREVYRLGKYPWWAQLESQQRRGRLALIFIGKELPTYQEVERAFAKALCRLSDEHDKI